MRECSEAKGLGRNLRLLRLGVACTAIALVWLSCSVTGAGQNSSPSPTISVATRLVQIGVIVRDKNGPVADLTKDDFVVLDRGKPRQLSLFSIEPANMQRQMPTPLPRNTFSDLPQYTTNPPRSVTIVLLDNLNTLYGSAAVPYESTPTWFEDLALANAKAHLVQYIKELDPRDRVAIYGLSRSLHVLCDFTSDREQILAILKKYDTRSVTNREAVESGAMHTPVPGTFNATVDGANLQLAGLVNQARGQITMDALRSIAAHVANVPGRKN
jgi:VWFA-related protein